LFIKEVFVTIFQELYDAINNWRAPAWLRDFLANLQTVIVKIAESAGQAYLSYLEAKIIEAAGNASLTSAQKFQFVWDAAKSGSVASLKDLKDNELNAIINTTVSALKASGKIA
jgi:hypothetical protein